MPLMVTDYRGHHWTILLVPEINKKAYATKNPDTDNPHGLGAEPDADSYDVR